MTTDSEFWKNLNLFALDLKDIRKQQNEYLNINPTNTKTKLNNDFILREIEGLFIEILKSTIQDKSPVLYAPKRDWSNVSFDNGIIQLKSSLKIAKLKFLNQASVSSFALTVHLLSKIYKLILTDNVCTKRELFYQEVALYKTQSVLDNRIDYIACMFQVPRRCLNIMATSKGCVAGNLNYTNSDGSFVDCAANPSGILVPMDVDAITCIQSNAKFVLVVEKDATFQKLLDENILTKLAPCILITGKGVPDLSTRLMVKRLWDVLALPILILVDADPYGIEIMFVYRFGSLGMLHETGNLAVPSIKWLGVLPTDILRLDLKEETLQSLTSSDRYKLRSFLSRPYLQGSSSRSLRHQIETMLEIDKKCEIQSLGNLGIHFLSDVYLSNKIRFSGWI